MVYTCSLHRCFAVYLKGFAWLYCRRKLIARIAELEDAVSQAQTRASKLEKERTSLQIEIREIVEESNMV